jgi:hypothetical protein
MKRLPCIGGRISAAMNVEVGKTVTTMRSGSLRKLDQYDLWQKYWEFPTAGRRALLS